MDDLSLLQLSIDWGADEALSETPSDRLKWAKAPTAHERMASSVRTLAELKATLENLAPTGLVFDGGFSKVDLMFVADFPGAEDGRVGKPLSGVSGHLFDRMLGSIGLTRDKVLVTHLVPWRLPEKRNPTDDEVTMCLPFLHAHIALTRPRYVVLLGGFVSRVLLGGNPTRGRWHSLRVPGTERTVAVLPTFHPAYLLRQPSAKREAWAHLLLLGRTLGGRPIAW